MTDTQRIMTSRSFPQLVLVAFLTIAVLSSVPLVIADGSDAEISVPGATETPTETVSIDGSSYEVDAFATVQSGDSLNVDVTSDSTFHIDLYDSEELDVDFRAGSGSDRVTFETDSIEPGTYMLALYVDGSYVDLHPVVIDGYEVSVDTSNEVSSDDESVPVTADVTPTALDSDPAGVEIVIWDDNTVLRESAEDLGNGQYETTFSMSDLEAGSYSVLAIAQGTATINGEPEALGISDSDTITVSDPQDDSSDFDDGTDNEATESEDEPDESNDESESDVTDETDESDDESEADETDDESESDESNDTDDANDSSDDTNGVQQPNLEDNDDTETDTDDSDAVPLAVVPVVVVAAGLAGVFVRMRR